MSYTITLDPTVLASGDNENVIVLVDTSGAENREVSLAVDYSDYYKRLAVAMETIATNSTTIAQKLTSIEDHLNTAGTASNLASKFTTMADEITTIDNNILTIANEITTIDNNILTIANEITTIDSNIDRIRVLGDYVGAGSPTAQGFKTRDDNTIAARIGTATLYKLYVEDGQILLTGDNVSEEQQQLAVNKLNSLIDRINQEF